MVNNRCCFLRFFLRNSIYLFLMHLDSAVWTVPGDVESNERPNLVSASPTTVASTAHCQALFSICITQRSGPVFPGHLLGRTRMVGGRRGRRRGEKSVPGAVAGVAAEAHQHAVSQFLQTGQAKGAGDLQLHAVRERRGKRRGKRAQQGLGVPTAIRGEVRYDFAADGRSNWFSELIFL